MLGSARERNPKLSYPAHPSAQCARKTLNIRPCRRPPPFSRATAPSSFALLSLSSCSWIPNPPPSPQVVYPRPQIHRPQAPHLLLRSSTLAPKPTALHLDFNSGDEESQEGGISNIVVRGVSTPPHLSKLPPPIPTHPSNSRPSL